MTLLHCQNCGLTRITGTGPCDECGTEDFRTFDKLANRIAPPPAPPVQPTKLSIQSLWPLKSDGEIDPRSELAKFPVQQNLRSAPEVLAAPYSAPFTTDVPQCCVSPETCNDPCEPRIAPIGYLVEDAASGEPDLIFPDEVEGAQSCSPCQLKFTPVYLRPAVPTAVEARDQRSEWVSIEERLPEQRQSVALVNVTRWENVGGIDWERNVHACGYLECWNSTRQWWSVLGERAQSLDAFTHWMPLPTPPQPGQQGRAPAADAAGSDEFESAVELETVAWLDVSANTAGMTPTERVLHAVKSVVSEAKESRKRIAEFEAGSDVTKAAFGTGEITEEEWQSYASSADYMQRDAQRYRWLRKFIVTGKHEDGHLAFFGCGEGLDKVLDSAARKGGEAGK